MACEDQDRAAGTNARMREFIRRKLRSIYEGFVSLAESEERLCVCNSLDFGSEELPQYEEPLVQHFYLLRYLPAYMAEYRMLYDKALSGLTYSTHLTRRLSVLSIGCGCGVDLWALRYALEARPQDRPLSLVYRGVDCIEWNHAETMDLPNAEVDGECDVGEDTDRIRSLVGQTNVLIFPKSLGDLSDDAFEAMTESLADASLACDEVLLLASLSATVKLDRLEVEEERLRQLSGILESQKGRDCSWRWAEDGSSERAITNACDGFIFPDDLLARIGNLRTLCRRSDECRLPCLLGHKPILTTKRFHLRVMRHHHLNR